WSASGARTLYLSSSKWKWRRTDRYTSTRSHRIMTRLAISTLTFLLCLMAGASCTAANSTDELAKELQPFLDRHDGKVSVAVKHLRTGEEFALNADEPMPTASLIKFPLMV